MTWPAQPMRILIAEDDDLLGDGITAGLKLRGHVVDWVQDGNEVLSALEGYAFDLVILDLMLPGRSGLDVLRRLRAQGDDVPVLVLTARDTVDDRVRGLDAGADDYLIKPFDLEELAARVRALHRRSVGHGSSALCLGGIELDPVRHSVHYHGEPVDLPRREFALLQALMESAGRILTRNVLEEKLYGWGDELESNALEVHVHNLRKKFGRELIQTVRGVGYRAVKPDLP